MKKKIVGRKFSRSSKARRALFRSLFFALVKEGRIKTTLAKAKSFSSWANKIFGIALEDTLAKRRQVLSKVSNKRWVMEEVFRLVGLSGRRSGFVRVTRLPARKGDNAPMARVEFLNWQKKEEVRKEEIKEEAKKVGADKVKKGKKK